MIRQGSILNVIDGSGIQRVKCLRIYNNRGFGYLGDLLLLIVQRVLPRRKFKKGERYRGVLVNTSAISRKSDGTTYAFGSNNVILFNKRMMPLSSKIKGPLYFKIKFTRFKRLATLARFLI